MLDIHALSLVFFLKVGGLLCTSLESAPFVVVIASSNWFWFLDHISAKS